MEGCIKPSSKFVLVVSGNELIGSNDLPRVHLNAEEVPSKTWVFLVKIMRKRTYTEDVEVDPTLLAFLRESVLLLRREVGGVTKYHFLNLPNRDPRLRFVDALLEVACE